MGKLESYIKLRNSSWEKSQEAKAEVYDLADYYYQFEKPSDRNGEITGCTQGGEIRVSIPDYPTGNILGWMLNPCKRMDGEVILCDGKAGTIHEHIAFENARCTNLHFSYNEDNEECIQTEIMIHAQRTSVSDSSHIKYE